MSALLENQRDQYIDQLAKLMDIRVVQGDNNQVSVFTGSGIQLVGTQAAQLNFSPTGTVAAHGTVECRSDQKQARNDHTGVARGRQRRSRCQRRNSLR